MLVAHFFTHVIPAYIDPGSGSIIFQAVAAGAMAVFLTVKVYWRKFKGFFSRSQTENE